MILNRSWTKIWSDIKQHSRNYRTYFSKTLKDFDNILLHVDTHFFYIFQTFFGWIFDIFWTELKLILDRIWTLFRFFLMLLSKFLAVWSRLWTKVGHILDIFGQISHRFWTYFGKFWNIFWIEFGHIFDIFWTYIQQMFNIIWTLREQIVAIFWTDFGHIANRFGTHFERIYHFLEIQ